MNELQILCDRILVMHSGRVVATFAGEDANDIDLGAAVLGFPAGASES